MRGSALTYTATYPISGLNSARTLLYISSPSDAVVLVTATHVYDESNETNEQLGIGWHRITTLGTPTATTLTPTPTHYGFPAAGSTVKGNVTASEPTYPTNRWDNAYALTGFPTLGGMHYTLVDAGGEPLVISPSSSYGLRIYSTPTSFDAIVTVQFEEWGG